MLTPDAIERLRALAAARGPLLIATDLDGTLAPIVEDPASARVPAETLATLQRLTTRAKVAVITGRDLSTARRMVPVEDVIVVGSHGLESSGEDLLPGVDRIALSRALELTEQLVLAQVPTAYLHVEHKAISTAFHYRTAPELEPALRKALSKLPSGLRLREGRRVLEAIPESGGGKDRALVALVNQHRARSLLVMGDDITDVAMFKAALELAKGGLNVVLAGVSGGIETPPEVVKLANLMLASTEEAAESLNALAEELGA